MTVYSNTSYTDWLNADGTNKNWSYDFTIFSVDDVIVQVRDTGDDASIVEYTTGFSFTPVDENYTGGYVTYPASGTALAATKQVRIVRNVPFTQTAEIGREGNFSPDIHERAFDKLTMLTQQLDNARNRSLLVPLGYTGYIVSPDISDDTVLKLSGGEIVEGPTADEVSAAQGYALAAAASAAAAAESETNAQTWDTVNYLRKGNGHFSTASIGLNLNGDGTEDANNLAKLEEALDFYTGDIAIELSQGNSYLSGTLNTALLTNRSVVIYGVGPMNSRLTVKGTSADALFTINKGSQNYFGRAKDFTVLKHTDGDMTGQVFNVIYTPGQIDGGVRDMFLIENVKARYADINNRTQFATLARLENVWNSVVRNCMFDAKTNKTANGLISLVGECTGVWVLHNRCYNSSALIGSVALAGQSQVFSEGINIHHNYAVACLAGVNLGDAAGAPGTFVTFNHFNCSKYGVKMISRLQNIIVGNEIYRTPTATDDFVGIWASASGVTQDICTVANNQLFGFTNASQSETAFFFDDCELVQLNNNYINGFDVGVDGNSTARVKGRGNDFKNITTNTKNLLAGSDLDAVNYSSGYRKRGVTSISTNASGNASISHGLNATPSYYTAKVLGNTFCHVQIASVGSSALNITIWDASGALRTSQGPFDVAWEAWA